MLAVLASSFLIACGDDEPKKPTCKIEDAAKEAACAAKQCGQTTVQDTCNETQTIECANTCNEGDDCVANKCVSSTGPTCAASAEQTEAACQGKCGSSSVYLGGDCGSVTIQCGMDCGAGKTCNLNSNACVNESSCELDTADFCDEYTCGVLNVKDSCGYNQIINCGCEIPQSVIDYFGGDSLIYCDEENEWVALNTEFVDEICSPNGGVFVDPSLVACGDFGLNGVFSDWSGRDSCGDIVYLPCSLDNCGEGQICASSLCVEDTQDCPDYDATIGASVTIDSSAAGNGDIFKSPQGALAFFEIGSATEGTLFIIGANMPEGLTTVTGGDLSKSNSWFNNSTGFGCTPDAEFCFTALPYESDGVYAIYEATAGTIDITNVGNNTFAGEIKNAKMTASVLQTLESCETPEISFSFSGQVPEDFNLDCPDYDSILNSYYGATLQGEAYVEGKSLAFMADLESANGTGAMLFVGINAATSLSKTIHSLGYGDSYSDWEDNVGPFCDVEPSGEYDGVCVTLFPFETDEEGSLLTGKFELIDGMFEVTTLSATQFGGKITDGIFQEEWQSANLCAPSVPLSFSFSGPVVQE
jgi:hypothetical protein